MIAEDNTLAYVGHRVFYDSSKGDKFYKTSFTILWKFIISIESSTNLFQEERFTCSIITVTGQVIQIVGNYKQLSEEFLTAIKYDKF